MAQDYVCPECGFEISQAIQVCDVCGAKLEAKGDKTIGNRQDDKQSREGAQETP